MIDWPRSQQLYGTTAENYKRRHRMAVMCDDCSATGDRLIGKGWSLIVNLQMPWRCKRCADEAARPKLVESSRRMWMDEGLAQQMLASRRTPEYREGQRAKAFSRYEDPAYRERVGSRNRANLSRPETRKRLSESLSRAWRDENHRGSFLRGIAKSAADPVRRRKLSESTRKLWSRPAYRSRMIKVVSDRATRLWRDDRYRRLVTGSCRAAYESVELRGRLSVITSSLWRAGDFKERVMAGLALRKEEFSESSRRRWADPSGRAKYVAAIKTGASRPDHIRLLGKISRARWTCPEFRLRHKESCDATWACLEFRLRHKEACNTPEFREKMAIALANQPKVSRPQSLFYSLLDDLGVFYYREHNDRPDDPECRVGPWSFDCVIPRKGRTTLLVELQGDWTHSRPRTVVRDKAKLSYINNNFGDRYEVKYVWEHELLCLNKVTELIQYWLGVRPVGVFDYSFDRLRVGPAPAADYRPLLEKYHYLSTAGRGGQAYGAYLDEVLVAVAVFSHLQRQNMPYNYYETRELSRLCVHPAYRRKNLISWFLSRSVKLLPSQVTKILSYCDTTFNHTGATYRACGFRHDGDVDPGYWYVGPGGWAMHKKTLYNRAVRCGMTESRYASDFGYVKRHGRKKLRFVLDLRR